MRYFKRSTFPKAASDLAVTLQLSLISKQFPIQLILIGLIIVLANTMLEPLYLEEAANSTDTPFSNSSTKERVFGYSTTGEYATPITERTLQNLRTLLNSGEFVITVSGPDATQEYKIYGELPTLPGGEVEDEFTYPLLCIYDTKYNVLLKGKYPVEHFSTLLDIEYDTAKPAFFKGLATLTVSGLALAGFVSLVTLVEIWASA